MAAPRDFRAPSVTDALTRRPLKIFAGDPMMGRLAGNRTVVEIDNDVTGPGPRNGRLHVIDYDGAHGRYYRPVNLDDPNILMQRGLEPSESDPRFHQQMVFAVASKTLENFDRALGWQLGFGGDQLRLFPHAFHGANAFYSHEEKAVLFGYFRADTKNPGPNLPGQTVFTCLSHDIIVHEVTHACVDRLRPHFLEPTNQDVLAFHEGFSDIVALFQHFTFPDILKNEIQRTRTDLSKPTLLAELARQFGFASGSGKALRSALEAKDPKRYTTVFEPHARGALLVGAVFDAFFETYQARIRDLVRIATGGTGTLPAGDLHPDLVHRIAGEAAKTAQIILTMCIRAFEYLPPVDVTFGDFLRALVTADYELYPEDSVGQRAAMIEAFRQRGIYPENVRSLAEESLLWECPPGLTVPPKLLEEKLAATAMGFGRGQRRQIMKNSAVGLHAFAKANAAQLKLDPGFDIAVAGFHASFRVGPDGKLVVEVVAQFVQKDESRIDQLGGVPLRGGSTVVISGDGRVRYVIAKPIAPTGSAKATTADQETGLRRLKRQLAYLGSVDERDPHQDYANDRERQTRTKRRMSFSALHGGR